MPDLSQTSAAAVAVQSVVGTYNAPGVGDLFPVAALRPNFEPYRVENPEFNGSIHKNGPAIIGKTIAFDIDILLRGPGGGSTPPAAGAFITGRILRALNMTENIISTAIPPAVAAAAAGTTTTVTLGATAAATAELYDGLLLSLPAQAGASANPAALSAIVDYTAAKVATLGETLSAEYNTGNQQIPKQIAYQMALSGSAPKLSFSGWLGPRRYNIFDAVPASARLRIPVAARGNNQYPILSVRLEGEFHSWSDDSAQVVPEFGPAPLFKDGDMWIAQKAFGGSSVEVDLGLRLDFAPNPNKASGAEAGEIVETNRGATLNINQTAKAYLDLLALSDAQTYHSVWAMWGQISGNTCAIVLPDCRFAPPNFTPDSSYVSGPLEAIIDRGAKSVNIVFPYW